MATSRISHPWRGRWRKVWVGRGRLSSRKRLHYKLTLAQNTACHGVEWPWINQRSSLWMNGRRFLRTSHFNMPSWNRFAIIASSWEVWSRSCGKSLAHLKSRATRSRKCLTLSSRLVFTSLVWAVCRNRKQKCRRQLWQRNWTLSTHLAGRTNRAKI